MDLVDGSFGAGNYARVRIVQHKCREGCPSRGVVQEVVPFGMLHDADTAVFPNSPGAFTILAAVQQVTFSERIPEYLIVCVRRPLSYRVAIVVQVPMDTVG